MPGAVEIAGRELLEARFDGAWPSFHDGEVHRMRLDHAGPSIELDVHVFRMTRDVDEDGFYVLTNHTLATLRFEGVVALRLEHLMQQNSLWDLTIEPTDDPEIDAPLLVTLEANLGLEGTFFCRRAAVVAAEPYTPPPREREPRPKVDVAFAADAAVVRVDAVGREALVALLRDPPDLLLGVHVHRTERPLHLVRTGDGLRIAGPPDQLRVLGDRIDAFGGEHPLRIALDGNLTLVVEHH